MLKGIFFDERDIELISEVVKNIDKKVADIIIEHRNNENVIQSMATMNNLIKKLQKQLGLR